MLNDVSNTFGRGLFAVAVNGIGVVTSMQEQIEWHLRVASLVIGITVGVLTAWSIIRKMRAGK